MDFDFHSDDIQVCLNYSVFDIDKGLLLKLGEGKEVLAAMKGMRSLSLEDI